MNKRELIIEKYRNLVISNKTTKISIKNICDDVHISRTTFYKYFKDCYAIMEDMFVHDALEPLKNVCENGINRNLVTQNWFLSFYKNKEFYIIAINDEGQNSLFHTILYEMEQFNRNLLEKSPSRNKLSKQDIEYYSYKNACLNVMLLKKWMQDGMIVSPEKMAEYYLHHLW